MTRPRVVVCGTRFGRVYLSALQGDDRPMDLVGIIGRGSERSRSCARAFGVPLFTDPADVPDDVDAACVVVSSAVNGGAGTELAKRLLARGINVLQEHPVHHDELASCLRVASHHGAHYAVNTHYPHVASVRAFIEAAQRLVASHDVLFLDGSCSIQTKFSFFDIIGQALGRLHPWGFGEASPSIGARADGGRTPFRALEGVIGGVPVTVRVQNQLHVNDPDNHAHVYHRVTLGMAGGSLTLVDTHGPLVWTARPHIPEDVREYADPAVSSAPSLGYPSWSPVASLAPPTWREIMTEHWPAAVRAALRNMPPLGSGAPGPQYQLTLARLVQDVNAALGPPELLAEPTPVPLAAVPGGAA